MYGNFFGLSSLPFEERADTRFYFGSTACEEALAFMEYEAKYGRSLASVTGAAGTGKTLLLRTLLMRFDTVDKVVLIPWPKEGAGHAVREVCKAFGVTIPSNYTPSRGLARLRRQLRRFSQNQQRAVLLIDQAENMTQDDLGHISALSDLQHGHEPLLTVLLVGQPRFRDTLLSPELSTLHQRLSGERVLSPMTNEETHAYIAHRLMVAGAVQPDFFDKSAIDLIHQASHGIPRLVNRMANEAMVTAYGRSQKQITIQVAREVVAEWMEPEAADSSGDVRVSAGASMPRHDVLSTGRNTASGDVSESVVPAHAAMQGQSQVASAAPFSEENSGAYDSDSAMPWHSSFGGDDDESTSTAEIDAITGGGYTEAAMPTADRDGGFPPASGIGSTGYPREANDRVPGMQQAENGGGSGIPNADATQSHLTQSHLTQSHATRANATLEMLQRATAHAERIGATNEAGLLQAQAVEKHLSILTTQAERLGTELSNVIQRGDSRSVEITERLEKQLANYRDRIGEFETEMQTARELVDNAGERAYTIREACDEADRTERALRTTAETLADQADTVQARIAAAMMESEAVTAANDHVDETLTRVRDVLPQAERTIEAIETRLAEATAQIERNIDESLKSFEHRLSEKLTASEKGLRRLEDRYGEIEQMSSKMQAILDGRERRLDLMLQRLGDAANQTADLETRVRSIMENHDEHVAAGQKLLGDVKTGVAQAEMLQRGLAGHLTDIGQAHREVANLRSQAAACEPVVAEMAGYLSKTERQCSVIEEVLSRAEAVEQDWVHLLAEGQVRSDKLRDQVADAFGDLQATAGELRTRLRSEAETALDDLHGAAREAGRQVEREISDRLEACGATAEQLARSTRGDLEKTRDVVLSSIEESKFACEETTSRLKFESEEAVERYRKIHTETTDAIQSLSAEADTKIAKLNSHHAAARQLIARLATSTKEGHVLLVDTGKKLEDIETRSRQTIDTVECKLNEALTTAERVDRLIADVWGLSEHVEVARKALQAGYDNLEPLVDRVTAGTGQGECVVAELREESKKADEAMRTLKRRSEQMSDLIGRLSSASKVLRNAGEKQQVLQALVSDAETKSETLKKQVADGEQRITALADEREASMRRSLDAAERGVDEVVERAAHSEGLVRDLVNHAMELTERHDHVMEHSRCMLSELEQVFREAGETRDGISELLGEFERQIGKVGESIGQLESRAIELERTVSDATDKPAALVEAAQTQAAQLERVCSAVKKVFASLSQRALEAKEEADACQEASRHASQNARAATAISQQIQGNLREWIDEASNVQSRLERTLDRAPSITQTHSSHLLSGLSREFDCGAGRGSTQSNPILSDPGLSHSDLLHPNASGSTRRPDRATRQASGRTGEIYNKSATDVEPHGEQARHVAPGPVASGPVANGPVANGSDEAGAGTSAKRSTPARAEEVSALLAEAKRLG